MINPNTTHMKDRVLPRKYYPRFHQIIRCFAVEVCEGEGTEESPMALVYYVHDEQGKLLGKIDEFGITSPHPDHD